MALAALCLQAQSSKSFSFGVGPSDKSQKPTEEIQFRAFVVDHGVRASSNEEARRVVQLLEGKGINIQPEVHPLTNFYQASKVKF
jgi:tRNA(Ile)-lysidine synthase